MLEALASTSTAVWVQESWGWALALTFHAFGTAIVVGLIFIIGLRLMGLFRPIPYSLLRKLIPIIWFGVLVQAGSGFLLWLSKPARYLADGIFQWKFSLVVISIIVTIYFQRMLKREAPGWDMTGKVSSRGAQFVFVTALLWSAVLVMGRLTAYLGQLYRAG